jgi:hypothetical protein
MALEIAVTKRFLRSYHKGSIGIQSMVEGAIHDFVRRYGADPQACIRSYERIAGTRATLLEFEISGGDRMIGHWSPTRLTLLDVGTHDLIGKFDQQGALVHLAEAVDAPARFWPDGKAGFFSTLPSRGVGHFGPEITGDWAYFLDDEQAGVTTGIYEAALDCLLGEGTSRAHCILGGPGTGKTAILLNLWKRFVDDGPFDVKLVLLPEVARYVEASMGIPATKPSPRGTADSCEVLLVDDPPSLGYLSTVARSVRQARAFVFAWDPLQMQEATADREYSSFISSLSAREHVLRTCYRQKANVGAATKRAADAIARSTPFLRGDKKESFWREHERLTELANDLTFRNPHGYVETYAEADLEDFRRELARLEKHSKMLWRHWSPLLLVLDDPVITKLPEQWQQVLDGFRHGVDVALRSEVEALKGLEYQHVFLVLGSKLYREIESGFEGSGMKLYNNRRLLRIPFSRAKDSLVTFVLTSDDDLEGRLPF